MFAQKYKVNYNPRKSCFSNAKDSYRAGEQVTLIYPFIATDTDYRFSVDGADYRVDYTGRGYELSFTMPDREVSVNVSWRNSMMCMEAES